MRKRVHSAGSELVWALLCYLYVWHATWHTDSLPNGNFVHAEITWKWTVKRNLINCTKNDFFYRFSLIIFAFGDDSVPHKGVICCHRWVFACNFYELWKYRPPKKWQSPDHVVNRHSACTTWGSFPALLENLPMSWAPLRRKIPANEHGKLWKRPNEISSRLRFRYELNWAFSCSLNAST